MCPLYFVTHTACHLKNEIFSNKSSKIDVINVFKKVDSNL